jgi:hypothetical protein
MTGPNHILESCELVSRSSKAVAINHSNIDRSAVLVLERINAAKYDTKAWKTHILHPKSEDQFSIDYIFLMDLLNFSFWKERSKKDMFCVTIGNVDYTGYWSLCACIQRALNEGIPITDSDFYSSASDEELGNIFRSNPNRDPIPMLDARIKLLRQAGEILSKYGGTFLNIIKQSCKSSQSLLSLILNVFGDIFDDSIMYNNIQVCFHKRAQILIADIWFNVIDFRACFEGRGYGEFYDIDTITMFADYRVPQSLLHFGILEYSQDVLDLLEKHQRYHSECKDPENNRDYMINRGHQYEVEIRY